MGTLGVGNTGTFQSARPRFILNFISA